MSRPEYTNKKVFFSKWLLNVKYGDARQEHKNTDLERREGHWDEDIAIDTAHWMFGNFP